LVALTSVAAVLRFGLELVLLAVFGTFGFTFPSPWSWILGLGLPALTLLVWSGFVAPRAPRHLDDPARLVVELVLFALGTGALAALGQWQWGVTLFVVFVIDRLVLDRWGKPEWAEPRLR
jgi:hypothetical protein